MIEASATTRANGSRRRRPKPDPLRVGTRKDDKRLHRELALQNEAQDLTNREIFMTLGSYRDWFNLGMPSEFCQGARRQDVDLLNELDDPDYWTRVAAEEGLLCQLPRNIIWHFIRGVRHYFDQGMPLLSRDEEGEPA